MPSVHENQYTRAQARSQTGQHSSQSTTPHRLRTAEPQKIVSLSDNDYHGSEDEPQPHEVDEPWRYAFRSGDAVWVRTPTDSWQPGIVSGQAKIGQTRLKEGLFYPVLYGEKTRKYFAPLNGEIKPDTSHIRRLLQDAGWL